ncbi:MAG: matrixin family metalloprotease [bacterium]
MKNPLNHASFLAIFRGNGNGWDGNGMGSGAFFITWGDAAINSTVMDLQNIAVHKIGHGAGLADLYDTVCTEETMYGYSNYGETKKRDLNAGDITGIQELYGGF